MRVHCQVWLGEEEREKDANPDWHGPEGDSTYTVPVTYARCSRCGFRTESYGDHHRSEARCLVLMREGCPRAEHNFYVNG